MEVENVRKKLRSLKKKFEKFDDLDERRTRRRLEDISKKAVDDAMKRLIKCRQLSRQVNGALSLYKEADETAVRRQVEKRYRKIERSFESIIDFPPGDVENAVCKFSFPGQEDMSSSDEDEDEIMSSFVESIAPEDRRKMNKKINREGHKFASESEDDTISESISTTMSTKAETLETISYAGSNLSSLTRVSKRSKKVPAALSASRGSRKIGMPRSEIKEESDECESISYAPSSITEISQVSRRKKKILTKENQSEKHSLIQKMLSDIKIEMPEEIYLNRKPIQEPTEEETEENDDNKNPESEGESTDPGVIPDAWRKGAPFRPNITSVKQYCDYIDCESVPYGVLEKVNLEDIVREGLPRIEIEKRRHKEEASDGWAPASSKIYHPIIANLIISKGNQGVDRGSMCKPIDAIVDTRSGEGTYYYVYERHNKRVQCFAVPQSWQNGETEMLESRGIFNGTVTNVVSTTASIARWGVNMCQYTVPRVTRGYRIVNQNHNSSITSTTLVFILTHNEEEPDNSHIKQFEAKEMKKIRDWKLPREIRKDDKSKKQLRFCKWGGVTMCLGDPFRPEPRLCTIAMLENVKDNRPLWYLIRWKVVDDVMYGKPKLTFLSWLNEKKEGNITRPINSDDVQISYMTSWGDQLYISDVGRHQVYLTDLEGNLRSQIGSKTYKFSNKEGEFHRPGSITVDAKGNFLVADELNHRISIFTCNGEYLGLVDHNFISMPCGLELLDDGRLIFFSKNTCKIYVTKLGPDFEDLEYRREESEGSKRFFGKGPDNYVRKNYNYNNRGASRVRGKGGFSQRGRGSSTQGFVRGGQNSSTFGNSGYSAGASAEPSEISDFSVASSTRYHGKREPDSGSRDGFTPFSETESIASRASVSSSRLNTAIRGRGRSSISKI